MSKTFKSAFEDSSYRLEVGKNLGAEHLSLWIVGRGLDSTSIAIDPSDAPALALAILEAAGVEATPMATSVAFGTVVADLQRLIAEQERITAEAEAQAKLEAEARDFYDTYHSASDWPYQDWAMLEDRYKAQFLAVARRAREINKENQ